MGNNLLLVGSVPLDTVEEVMRTFGGALSHLPGGVRAPGTPGGRPGAEPK